MLRGKETVPEGDGTWRMMLLAKPVQNSAADVEISSMGSVTVHVKRQKPWYYKRPFSWVIPVKETQSVIMDDLGSRIWELCDGERDVEAVVDRFASQHELSFHESRVAVTGYIKELIRRGALAIVFPQDRDA